MFSAAARTLAGLVLPSDLELGRIYPSLTRIREVSAHIGAAVAEVAFGDGLAGVPRPPDLLSMVQASMWQPVYPNYA
jgi:malate dehydrogenase (oxaloacetate-decarboxylating)(NADP+)